MTVYVDDMEVAFTPAHRPGATYVMSHMISTDPTHEELHQMADRIGVARRWFQRDHYDVALSKRALAIKYGAVKVPRRILALMAVNRRFGWPMGTPETAEQIAYERRERSVNIEALHGEHTLTELVLDRTGPITQNAEAAFKSAKPLMINGNWYNVISAEPSLRGDYPVIVFQLQPTKNPYEP